MVSPGSWLPPPPWKGPPLPSWMLRPSRKVRGEPSTEGPGRPAEDPPSPLQVEPEPTLAAESRSLGEKPAPPPTAPREAQPDSIGPDQDPAQPDEDELVLVLRSRARNPTWLKPHQERLVKANQVAAERTRHLAGTDRVVAMNQVVAEEMARLKGEGAPNAS